MNTYSVVWYPPGSSTAAPPQFVPAKEMVVEEDFVVFLGASGQIVFAVPVALDPVVTLTASA